MTVARAWWWFVPVAIVFAAVATHRMELPGIYADSINPDYLVTRILNPQAERSMVWVLVGNSLLGDRAPVLISLYHGSQQFWLGLPLYAIFGTTVTGVRLTHATFALFVLAALFALLVRGGARPWLAALTCACLALDCAFSYSFRVQAYITVAPAAWLLMGLYALTRATRSAEHYPGRWLVASGRAVRIGGGGLLHLGIRAASDCGGGRVLDGTSPVSQAADCPLGSRTRRGRRGLPRRIPPDRAQARLVHTNVRIFRGAAVDDWRIRVAAVARRSSSLRLADDNQCARQRLAPDDDVQRGIHVLGRYHLESGCIAWSSLCAVDLCRGPPTRDAPAAIAGLASHFLLRGFARLR